MEFWPFGVLRFTRRNRLTARRSPPPLHTANASRSAVLDHEVAENGAEEVQVHASKDRDITRDCAVEDGVPRDGNRSQEVA